MSVVVLEGFDGSGKSTLAEYLGNRLGMPVVHSGGPSQGPEEIFRRTEKLLDMDRVIFDRHTCISQEIYRIVDSAQPRIPEDLIRRFYAADPVLVYCQRTVPSTVNPDIDTIDFQRRIQTNQMLLLNQYESWAIDFASLIYRIGDPLERVAKVVEAYL